MDFYMRKTKLTYFWSPRIEPRTCGADHRCSGGMCRPSRAGRRSSLSHPRGWSNSGPGRSWGCSPPDPQRRTPLSCTWNMCLWYTVFPDAWDTEVKDSESKGWYLSGEGRSRLGWSVASLAVRLPVWQHLTVGGRKGGEKTTASLTSHEVPIKHSSPSPPPRQYRWNNYLAFSLFFLRCGVTPPPPPPPSYSSSSSTAKGVADKLVVGKAPSPPSLAACTFR